MPSCTHAFLHPCLPAFFHSFTGAVVYGHGTPTNVPKALRPVVAILSDALFMVGWGWARLGDGASGARRISI